MSRWDNYFMDIAIRSADMSYCERMKVGAVAVRNRRPICTGWNGMPAGGDNCCEETRSRWVEDKFGMIGYTERFTLTKPEVTHAERNLIEFAAKEGMSLNGATMYITHSPCIECAKAIHNVGIVEVVYLEKYRCDDGLEHLNKYDVTTRQYQP